MESKSEEAMKLLAKKIEQAARDSAIKCVEEAEGMISILLNVIIILYFEKKIVSNS